jgi:hypothetical protein
MSAFIDDYIWEIPMFPRTGVSYNKYTISDIYHYNSEESKEYNSPRQNIQIPENVIVGPEKYKKFIRENKELIVKNKIPAIINILNSNGEEWVINIPQIDYLKYHLN